MNYIETARSPESAITIISEEECKAGLKELRKIFIEVFPDPQKMTVIPILRSGFRLGKELTDHLGIKMNPMQMSYYKNDTSRLQSPVCLTPPDITRIISIDGTTKHVVFTECVVDSQETVLAAMLEINRMIDVVSAEVHRRLDYPEYSTFAYVSKTGEHPIQIPNLVTAFRVHPDIWVGGLGCDLPGDKGRELPYLVGMVSPFASKTPKRPYFVSLFT
ncbi:MAG: hypothetical protein UW41_C0009G0009 [Candidatus Collierbacteria bacterium GW2011_GWC2_44_18]|uniref:Hypoxanthine phosphoribosyltransferase n=2 Tax=Microgenomates group TaxID=1794810 RepID=A0A0G1LFH1_9BACT|nr:MAG: hypothetical protein UW16_C0005G0011 [Microgenomates group bacterium GW2011_GWC1_44_10]KKT49242.1 MAG: hypothetical protein UW41_C0009G0009 [Candidatus Collierbacteria bacterium GW2011_GWC2_44_18]KKT67447.1 MAG: hypothetical protein UW60_C0006G0011 [Candidatus Woesebacteria bacterium GW2011_GWA2_44_33]